MISARGLLIAALPLTFIVVVAGAFVRLSDAGLGCPDWPGCYGDLVGVADEQQAAQHYPDSPYDRRKAMIEVGHRYLAGLLGLLLLAAAAVDTWRRRHWRGLPQLLLLFVILQALLGMLTVTDKLRPIVVTAHLLGGMLILALLAAAVTRKPLSAPPPAAARRRLHTFWAVTAALLFGQIALGGWVSSNEAGLACPDFPHCHGGWLPPVVDFSGFSPLRPRHQNIDGTPVTAAALATIHWIHRLAAVALSAAIAVFIAALSHHGARREGIGLAVFFVIQIMLGILNVVWQLPLPVAVMHNAVAAILIINMAVLRVKLSK